MSGRGFVAIEVDELDEFPSRAGDGKRVADFDFDVEFFGGFKVPRRVACVADFAGDLIDAKGSGVAREAVGQGLTGVWVACQDRRHDGVCRRIFLDIELGGEDFRGKVLFITKRQIPEVFRAGDGQRCGRIGGDWDKVSGVIRDGQSVGAGGDFVDAKATVCGRVGLEFGVGVSKFVEGSKGARIGRSCIGIDDCVFDIGVGAIKADGLTSRADQRIGLSDTERLIVLVEDFDAAVRGSEGFGGDRFDGDCVGFTIEHDLESTAVVVPGDPFA